MKVVSDNVALSQKQKAGDFLATARLLATHRGSLPAVLRAVEEGHYSAGVQAIAKNAVNAGSLSSASAIAPYDSAVAAFFESLQHVGIFDKILADGAFRRVPIKGRGVVVTGAASGNKITEGMVKPISSLELDGETLAPKKSLAVLAVTQELLKLGAPGTSELFNSELRTAVAAATDAEFLSTLYAATTPTASAGTTIDAVLEDLDVLLAAIPSGARARFCFAVDSTNAKRLAVKSGNGVPAVPKFGINGGEIIPGVMGLVSDSLRRAQRCCSMPHRSWLTAAKFRSMWPSTRAFSLIPVLIAHPRLPRFPSTCGSTTSFV